MIGTIFNPTFIESIQNIKVDEKNVDKKNIEELTTNSLSIFKEIIKITGCGQKR